VSAMRTLILPVQLVVNVTAGMLLPLATSVVHMNVMIGGIAPLACSTDSKFYKVMWDIIVYFPYSFSLCVYVRARVVSKLAHTLEK
jgi:hypothetical protein